MRIAIMKRITPPAMAKDDGVRCQHLPPERHEREQQQPGDGAFAQHDQAPPRGRDAGQHRVHRGHVAEGVDHEEQQQDLGEESVGHAAGGRRARSDMIFAPR
jgi:hypothetical protein